MRSMAQQYDAWLRRVHKMRKTGDEDPADVKLADRIAALIGNSRGEVLYELRYGSDTGMRKLAEANRRAAARRRDEERDENGDDEETERRRRADEDEDDEGGGFTAAERERILAAGLELRRKERKASTMTRTATLRSIVKEAGGVTALCKRIVRRGDASGISEHELTALISDAAKAARPDLTPEQAFSKMYESSEVLRRATAIAKAFPVMPTQVGGADVDVDDPAKALDQIKQLIARMRAAAPDLSESDAWDRVVRAYPQLARRAIPIPAPGMAHAYPWR